MGFTTGIQWLLPSKTHANPSGQGIFCNSPPVSSFFALHYVFIPKFYVFSQWAWGWFYLTRFEWLKTHPRQPAIFSTKK
jgi:hypothetical protein